MKRSDYITWDEYFMGVASLSAQRSKDPSTQVGACIVSQDHKILSMGYNGFPIGCSDDDFSWDREGDDNKYYYSTHSELNAILNYRGGSLEGAVIYVTLFPCNECAKAIIQSGIKKVIFKGEYPTGLWPLPSRRSLHPEPSRTSHHWNRRSRHSRSHDRRWPGLHKRRGRRER